MEVGGSDRADWDADDDSELDEEDARLSRMVVEHYQGLLPEDLGCGFLQRGLETFHQGPNLPTDGAYFTTPRSLQSIPRYDETPAIHPLRAVAWILNEAVAGTTIRVFCYRLTDIVAIELLVHAGSKCEVQVILSPDAANERGLNDFVDAVGPIGRNAILENMEIRLANLSGSLCESRQIAMHQTSIITDQFAASGSYNLSTTFARDGNWEEVCIVPATQSQKTSFDEMWDQLYKTNGTIFPPLSRLNNYIGTKENNAPRGTKQISRTSTAWTGIMARIGSYKSSELEYTLQKGHNISNSPPNFGLQDSKSSILELLLVPRSACM